MRITNNLNLPKPIWDAAQNDDRGDTGDISVTQLLKPPRMLALERQHDGEIEEDVSDMVWLLLGRSVHALLEMSGTDGVQEERLGIDVNGWRVTGQFDHLSLVEESGAAILSDFKVTSVWSVVYESRQQEWEEQLNLYAHLLREHGYRVDGIQAVCILRDWQKNRVGDDYPDKPIKVVPLELWSPSFTAWTLEVNVGSHQEAGRELPQCDDSDRWAKPDQWAVHKRIKSGEPAKRATKLHDDMQSAMTHAENIDGVVMHRPGDKWVRCRDWCRVGKAGFCTQYQEGKDD